MFMSCGFCRMLGVLLVLAFSLPLRAQDEPVVEPIREFSPIEPKKPPNEGYNPEWKNKAICAELVAFILIVVGGTVLVAVTSGVRQAWSNRRVGGRVVSPPH
jgi:hypothetical protein